MSEKKFSISLDKNQYKITFYFLIPGDIVVNVDFYLKEEKINNTMALNDVYSLMDKLEEENKTFKDEINKLKNEDKILKESLDSKNVEIMDLKNEIIEIKKENEFIKGKMKCIEDKLNNISNNINNNVNIKNETNFPDNKIENKNEIKINHNSDSECKSIPNNSNSCIYNENNKQKNIPKNIIIDEDYEEEKDIEDNNNSIHDQKKKKNNFNNDKNDNNNYSKDLKNKKVKTQPLIPKNQLENINLDTLFNSSLIIKTKQEKLNLYNWLTMKGGNIKEIKLIFQSSKDGDEYETFFSKCGDKGPTLILIESKNQKKFGGFSKAKWTNKKGKAQIKDESAFVFSLDKLKKYDVLKSEIAIVCYPDDYLIMYGNNYDRYGLRIKNGFLENGNYENFKNKSYDINEPFGLSGENEFFVEELEVFLITFE